MSVLRRSKSGSRGVRRFVWKQVRAALRSLDDPGLRSDETVHDTRMHLKRARAGLRLLREAMGKKRYRHENALVRDIGRPLTDLRDARVLLDTLKDIAQGVRNRAVRRDLRAVREGLEKRRRDVRGRLEGSIPQLQRSLRKESKRARQWPVGHHGWSVVGPGLKRVYRNGRKTLARAQQQRS